MKCRYTFVILCLICLCQYVSAQNNNSATIYIIHKNNPYGGIVKCDISINDEYIGTTKVKRFLKTKSSAQSVTIKTKPNNGYGIANMKVTETDVTQEITIDIESNESIYLLVSYGVTEKEGAFLNKAQTFWIEQITQEKAFKYISKYKQIQL